MNIRLVHAVAYKEVREILRDRIFFLMVFTLPLMLMIVFGHGLSQDVEHVPFAVADYDRSASSRDYVHRFVSSRYFQFKGVLEREQEADALLADGAIRFVLVIPEHFEERLTQGRRTEVQTLFDGTFTRTIRTVKTYIEAINSAAAGALQAEYVARHLGVTLERARVLLQPVKIETRYLYNQEVRSIWAIAPGLIMFVLTLTSPLLMALGVVREKETGSIYNIYASTISRAEFLAGKLLPYVVISFINGVVLWAMATFYFGAPFKGSLSFFFLSTLLYVLCASSMGLLLSLLVRTQQAALMVSVIVGFIISISFSGIFTPVSSLSESNAVIAHLFPAMYYNTIIESSFLKGMGFSANWWELIVFLLFSAVILLAAYLLFHKRTRS